MKRLNIELEDQSIELLEYIKTIHFCLPMTTDEVIEYLIRKEYLDLTKPDKVTEELKLI